VLCKLRVCGSGANELRKSHSKSARDRPATGSNGIVQYVNIPLHRGALKVCMRPCPIEFVRQKIPGGGRYQGTIMSKRKHPRATPCGLVGMQLSVVFFLHHRCHSNFRMFHIHLLFSTVLSNELNSPSSFQLGETFF